MKSSVKTIAFYTSVLTGLGLLFIGSRFFIVPEAATYDGFGVHVPTNNDYSFQYIKGIRDIFTGAIVLVFLLLKEWRALGAALVLGCIIPATDFLVVFSHPDHETAKLF